MSSRRSRNGGKADLDGVQAVQQVLAKTLVVDFLLHLDVGGRDDTGIDTTRPERSRRVASRRSR